MLHAFCEQLKNCGRNGAPFFFAFAAVIGSVSLGPWGGLVFLALVCLGLVWVLLSIAEQRDKFEPLGRMPPLGESDLRAARSKLVGHHAKR